MLKDFMKLSGNIELWECCFSERFLTTFFVAFRVVAVLMSCLHGNGRGGERARTFSPAGGRVGREAQRF